MSPKIRAYRTDLLSLARRNKPTSFITEAPPRFIYLDICVRTSSKYCTYTVYSGLDTIDRKEFVTSLPHSALDKPPNLNEQEQH